MAIDFVVHPHRSVLKSFVTNLWWLIGYGPKINGRCEAVYAVALDQVGRKRSEETVRTYLPVRSLGQNEARRPLGGAIAQPRREFLAALLRLA